MLRPIVALDVYPDVALEEADVGNVAVVIGIYVAALAAAPTVAVPAVAP